MKNFTIENSDNIVKKLYEIVDSNKLLKAQLKNAPDCKNRWMNLELFILPYLVDVGLDEKRFQTLWIRERFFYEMQQKTKMDFGFCRYFIPAFRNRTQSILENDLTLDLDNKCTYGLEKPIMTTCSGTDRDICVFLHPELKEQRDKIINDYVKGIVEKMNISGN